MAKKHRMTTAERAAAKEEQLAEHRRIGYKTGVADGRAQVLATYDERRFAMAEKLVEEAVCVSRYSMISGVNDNVARVIEALAHMMPYRGTGTQQRP